MAIFTLVIETPAMHRPLNRVEDVRERAILQSLLLTAVNAISNAGSYSGSINGRDGATATFGYEVDNG
jgi:hypothetical protein